MSTPIKESFNIEKISDRKASYGIDGLTIDGNNVMEVFNTVAYFRQECLKGKGPVLIEAKTYRWRGHSKSDAQVYRTKKEVKEWMDKDPIKRYEAFLIEEKIITKKEADDIAREAEADIEKASKFADSSPFPDTATVEEDVYA
jgi:pyruvate dehydrogenase E1 component alpha subunit